MSNNQQHPKGVNQQRCSGIHFVVVENVVLHAMNLPCHSRSLWLAGHDQEVGIPWIVFYLLKPAQQVVECGLYWEQLIEVGQIFRRAQRRIA